MHKTVVLKGKQRTLDSYTSRYKMSPNMTNLNFSTPTTFESPIPPTEQTYEPLDPKQGVILFVIILPGLIGNIFALVSTAKIMKLQVKVAPNYYVFALSSIDLFLLVACCSPTLVCYVSGGWQGGQIMCDFQGIMSLFCSLSSGSVAALLAVDRFFAVTKPFLYRSHITISIVMFLITTAVLISMVISLLPVAGFGSFLMNLTGTYCTINWFSTVPKHTAFSYIYACIGFGLVATIVTVNITVIGRLINERRKKAIIFTADLSSTTTSRQEKRDSNLLQRPDKQNANQTQDGRLSVACRAPPGHSRSSSRQTARRLRLKHTDLEVRAVKLSIAISVVFLFCWVPFMVRIIGNQNGWRNASMDVQVSRLLILNSVLDPFVYVLTRRQYRRMVWACVRCRTI